MHQQSPYHVNILMAGFDEGVGASLYYMDYLGTMHKMNVAGTGYGTYKEGERRGERRERGGLHSTCNCTRNSNNTTDYNSISDSDSDSALVSTYHHPKVPISFCP